MRLKPCSRIKYYFAIVACIAFVECAPYRFIQPENISRETRFRSGSVIIFSGVSCLEPGSCDYVNISFTMVDSSKSDTLKEFSIKYLVAKVGDKIDTVVQGAGKRIFIQNVSNQSRGTFVSEIPVRIPRGIQGLLIYATASAQYSGGRSESISWAQTFKLRVKKGWYPVFTH